MECVTVNAMMGSMQLIGMWLIDREKKDLIEEYIIDPTDHATMNTGRFIRNKPVEH